MLDPSQQFARTGWYLFPGPLAPRAEPVHTVALDEITEYDYPEVAAAILAVPGARCLHPSEPRWDNWRAVWERDERTIEVDMFPDCEHLSSEKLCRCIWSGGWLHCNCKVGDLAGFLQAVRARCPGVWLCDGGDHIEHGGSRLHTPETFLAMPGLPWDEPPAPHFAN
jgi:hypothetical protein